MSADPLVVSLERDGTDAGLVSLLAMSHTSHMPVLVLLVPSCLCRTHFPEEQSAWRTRKLMGCWGLP